MLSVRHSGSVFCALTLILKQYNCGMRSCIVLYFHNDRWLKRALSIVLEELDRGRTPVVLDIGGYATPNFGGYYRYLSRITSRFFPFKHSLKELGVEYVDLSPIRGPERNPTQSMLESFELGIQSHCYSLLRTDNIEGTAYGRSVYRKISKMAKTCYEKSYEFLKDGNFEEVFIPNFRYSSQKATMLAAIDLGLVTRYFEADGPVNLDRYLNLDYPVHDRVSAQRHALELTKNLSEVELDEFAKNFIKRRFGVSPTENQYSSNWTPNGGQQFLNELQETKARRIGIFTSSIEEMWGLGSDWEAGWADQWEAIESVLRLPYLIDDTFVLRVHPNLGNKERGYFKREQSSISKLASEFPNLRIVHHNSDVDSYQLIETLDLVVVFASTIGLEATLKGKPVLRLAPTFYDLLVDCSVADDPSSLLKISEDSLFRFHGWQGAAKYVAYKELRSQPLHQQVPMHRRFDFSIPLLGVPVSSLPVRFEPLRYYFVLRQLFFRKLQKRTRTNA